MPGFVTAHFVSYQTYLVVQRSLVKPYSLREACSVSLFLFLCGPRNNRYGPLGTHRRRPHPHLLWFSQRTGSFQLCPDPASFAPLLFSFFRFFLGGGGGGAYLCVEGGSGTHSVKSAWPAFFLVFFFFFFSFLFFPHSRPDHPPQPHHHRALHCKQHREHPEHGHRQRRVRRRPAVLLV